MGLILASVSTAAVGVVVPPATAADPVISPPLFLLGAGLLALAF